MKCMLIEYIIANTTPFRDNEKSEYKTGIHSYIYHPPKHTAPPQTQTVFCKGVSMIKGLLRKLPKEILLLRG